MGEAELKGKIQIGKGAKLKVQPSTRDRCRKKKCPVKFGGPKENDEEEDDTTATKEIKKKKREANKIASKIRANKIKARSLLRDVVGKTKKDKAFLARSKEATNNADGGGRRRLSELEITHDKVEAALQKEGLTMTGSECDVDSVKTKRYCATKTAAAVHDALENGLGLEKEKGKTLVEALETMRKKLKKDRDLDSADVDTESTEEEATLEKEADDKLDVRDSPKDRLDFIKRYAAFKKKRKETKVTEKISCEIGSGSTMEVEEGASVEIEKGGDLAVKGKLIAPKGSTIVCTRGATLDLTSTDSEGA